MREIPGFISGYVENSGPTEGLWLRNRAVPPLPEVSESFQGYVGKRLHEINKEGQSKGRGHSEFGTPRGEKSGNMEATGLGVNRGQGPLRITAPAIQIERLRAQPHLNTTAVPASPIDTRAAPLGKAGMTVGIMQRRKERDAVCFGREAQQEHTPSKRISQGRSPTMSRDAVVIAPPRLEGKNPRQWLSRISCYYESLGVEDEEK